ncbi:hypothetical protein [Enterococcus pallens]|uniref:Uncharacterized protein n=1 Tax=Enterococcus pallens ATCC BAA-351 TaxID=1158607 RepID=R2SX72_9ENTE|nr:hypothetical protein [Enterococcus pallens]EOH97376.1 hypothetical protein UAU_00044 [Enterococcus pallens ATCC BAA-351]EOU21205.1 hypothetical protein I588_02052 [Enterococcus pallens ATCC BAA-351]OJG80590.1 hypothetical protein RV10_GL004327 [Enterococcus pallens]
MFNSSKRSFRINYFISSFLPTYIFLLLILIIKHFEVSGEILPISYHITSTKVVFFLTVVLLTMSFICLLGIKSSLENILENSKSRGEKSRSAYITRNYNIGMREFLLSVLVPVMTTISIEDSPITGFCSMLILQILIYFFYSNSSEYFPNLSLQLIRYSVINGIDKESNKEIYLFVKTYKISEMINESRQFVYFGKSNKNSEVGIITEGE